jgi:hypothetical protein
MRSASFKRRSTCSSSPASANAIAEAVRSAIEQGWQAPVDISRSPIKISAATSSGVAAARTASACIRMMRCGASHDFSAREAAANEPAGAPFLPALKCDFRQSFDRQNAPGHRAYLKMKSLSLHEPLLGCIEVSGK